MPSTMLLQRGVAPRSGALDGLEDGLAAGATQSLTVTGRLCLEIVQQQGVGGIGRRHA